MAVIRVMQYKIASGQRWYFFISNNEILNSFKVNLSKLERWPSGRRRTLGKRVYITSVSRVRIPVSPQGVGMLLS